MSSSDNIRESLPTHHQCLLRQRGASSNFHANADYSAAATDFVFEVPAGKVAAIFRMMVVIGEGSTIAADKYGAIDRLPTGIHIETRDSSNTAIQTIGYAENIHTTIDWAAHCYDMSLVTTGAGLNSDYALFRWSFSRAGMPIVLNSGESFVVTFNDNLDGLSEHRFVLNGVFGDDTSKFESMLVNMALKTA